MRKTSVPQSHTSDTDCRYAPLRTFGRRETGKFHNSVVVEIRKPSVPQSHTSGATENLMTMCITVLITDPYAIWFRSCPFQGQRTHGDANQQRPERGHTGDAEYR